MARQKRQISKTGIYHILLRGVNNLFSEKTDYDEFMGLLKKHIEKGNIKVIAYLLLPNRIHLIIDDIDGNVGVKLKPITTSYARYYNRTRVTGGKLFYDRFKSEPLDTKKDLVGAVAFINAISRFEGKNYIYSSLNEPICSAKECGLTKTEMIGNKFSRMYIEDYDCLTKKELGEYIFMLCGITPSEFRTLNKIEQDKILLLLTEKYWISKSKIYELLLIKKPTSQGTVKKVKTKQENKSVDKTTTSLNKAEKEEIIKPKKKGLSVWLL